ncbi:hypothetical protein H0W91_03940 [Patescibacteria group bacterium]|nr:hypothetical protein [Patescibacteria group bacterium]
MDNKRINPWWYTFLKALIVFLISVILFWWALNALASSVSHLVPSIEILLFLIVLLSFPISFYLLRQKEKSKLKPPAFVSNKPQRTFTSILRKSISIGLYVFLAMFILSFVISRLVNNLSKDSWGIIFLIPLFIFVPILSVIISFIIIKVRVSKT